MLQIVPELFVLRGFPPDAINVYLLGDVLRPLGTGPSGSQMPGVSWSSLNTLRTYTTNISDKLGVNTRLAAVYRAEGLHLS